MKVFKVGFQYDSYIAMYGAGHWETLPLLIRHRGSL
jgi:hypothetical protein